MKLVSEKQSMHRYVYIHMIKEIDDVFIFSYTQIATNIYVWKHTKVLWVIYEIWIDNIKFWQWKLTLTDVTFGFRTLSKIIRCLLAKYTFLSWNRYVLIFSFKILVVNVNDVRYLKQHGSTTLGDNLCSWAPYWWRSCD